MCNASPKSATLLIFRETQFVRLNRQALVRLFNKRFNICRTAFLDLDLSRPT